MNAQPQPSNRYAEETYSKGISVILSILDGSHLVDALASLASQTFQDFEVIVIHGGGAEIFPVIDAFQSQMTVHYLRHSGHLDRCAALNTGLRAAQGKYIAYMSEKDNFYPDHLQTLAQFLETSDYQVAYSDALQTQGTAFPDVDPDRLSKDNFIPMSCMMHTKACLEEVGYFDEACANQGDGDLWVRMSQKLEFAHIKKVTAELSLDREDQGTADQERRASSIILPVSDHVEQTRLCLESLIQNTPEDLFEVVIVDNGSTDGTREFLQCLEGDVRIITNQKPLGFAQACNQGAGVASGSCLVFVENNAAFRPGWLENMRERLERGERVGMDEEVGSCLFIDRERFFEVGGFDEGYKNGWEKIALYTKANPGGKSFDTQGESLHSQPYAGLPVEGRV
jgi:glycosyltransferase involved in cell wall biosynthesis